MTEPSSEESEQVEVPQVPLNGPGPSTLADLQSQARDLSFAAACMRECLRYAREDDEEALQSAAPVPQALFNAGLISYRRAFTSGRAHLMPKKSRFSLKEALPGSLTVEQQAMHEDMLKVANEHIAHRVGEGEEAIVVALLAPPPEKRAVAAVGSLAIHFLGPTEEWASKALALCDAAGDLLQSAIEQRSDALIANLRETADIDELYKGSSTPGTSPAED